MIYFLYFMCVYISYIAINHDSSYKSDMIEIEIGIKVWMVEIVV